MVERKFHYEMDVELQVSQEAISLREAIVATRDESASLLSRMKRFPIECCDIACRLLWMWFHDCGITGFQIYSGKINPHVNGEHCWLQHQDLIVDITADQFGKAPIIVTRESEFHRKLDGKRWASIKFDEEYLMRLKSDQSQIGAIYRLITANLSLSAPHCAESYSDNQGSP